MTPIVLGSRRPPFSEWLLDDAIGTYPLGEEAPGRFPGDATYGYDFDALLTPLPLPEEPRGFMAFWARTAAQAASLPLSLEMDAPAAAPGRLANTHTVRTARFRSAGGFEIGAWLLLPIAGPVARNLTILHGYGGRAAPDFEGHLLKSDDAAIIPCLRGLGELSTHPDIPQPGREHVLHGIESRDDYVLRYCVMDAWHASDELDALTQADEHLLYGPSFGGGIGALALLTGRYERAALYVPTFGNQPLRLGLPNVGSGAGLRERYQSDPGILDVLAYFDAATAASHVTVPTMVVAALWDPSVAPPGQLAVYHALAGEKQLVVQDAAHTDYPGMGAQARAREQHLMRWLH